MDKFQNAKTVRLRSQSSHHERYLIAEENKETVIQNRNGSTRNARWTVEFVESGHAIRLKSCYGKYLTASNMPFLIGMSGRKVLQTLPRRLDSSLEWEPVNHGSRVRLRTRYGNFLRGNGRLPPWRNSVTHDVPHRSSTQDWVLWNIDVVEIINQSGTLKMERKSPNPEPYPIFAPDSDPVDDGLSSSPGSDESGEFYMQQSFQSSNSVTQLPSKHEGRLIYYQVADEHGEVDESEEANSFVFEGHNVMDLTRKLEEETEIKDTFVCTRSPLNGKLFPLRLQLPPNNQEMRIVVVPSTSKLGRQFAKEII